MEKPSDGSKSAPEATEDLSVEIVPHESPVSLRQVSPASTEEERRDPMDWLSKNIVELFKEERRIEESASKGKAIENDPYGRMNDAFPGIFKNEEKNNTKFRKEGSFKINPVGTTTSSQDRKKRKVRMPGEQTYFTVFQEKRRR